MKKIIYHTLDDIASNSVFAERILDLLCAGPNMYGYDWRDNWSSNDKKGPNSTVYHILNALSKKSNLAEEMLNTISMSPKIEGYDWRYLWNKKDN